MSCPKAKPGRLHPGRLGGSVSPRPSSSRHTERFFFLLSRPFTPLSVPSPFTRRHPLSRPSQGRRAGYLGFARTAWPTHLHLVHTAGIVASFLLTCMRVVVPHLIAYPPCIYCRLRRPAFVVRPPTYSPRNMQYIHINTATLTDWHPPIGWAELLESPFSMVKLPSCLYPPATYAHTS